MNFSSILDKNYITRLDALLFSLNNYISEYKFFVVSLDDVTYNYYSTNKKCIPIHINEIHAFYPFLDKVKLERDHVSYVFTLSPFYPSFILQKHSDLNHICSLDSDQFFFSSPQPIFNLLATYSVLITPHRFTKKLLELNFERFGKYNVSFQVFKNDTAGNSCLGLWRDQCLNWCYDREENDLYADQKYLDSWSEKFPNKIFAINNVGVGLSPWNIDNYEIKLKSKKVLINNEPLILFHYQGLKLFDFGIIYTYLDHYFVTNTKIINRYIYPKIIKQLTVKKYSADKIIRNQLPFNTVFFREKEQFLFKYLKGKIISFKYYLIVLKCKNFITSIRRN